MGIKSRFRGGRGAGRGDNPHQSWYNANDPEGQRTVAQDYKFNTGKDRSPNPKMTNFDPFSREGAFQANQSRITDKLYGESDDSPFNSPAQTKNRKGFNAAGKKSFTPDQPLKDDLPF